MPREEKESSNNSSPPVTNNPAEHTRTLLPETSQEPTTFDHSSPNNPFKDNRGEPSSSNKSDLSYKEITRPEDTLMDKENKVSNTTETTFSKQKLAQSTEFRKRGEIKNFNEVYSDESSSTTSDESTTLEELAELAAIEERLDQLLPPMESTSPTLFIKSTYSQSVTSNDSSDSRESSLDECPKYKKLKLDDSTKLQDSLSDNSSSKFKDSSSSDSPKSEDSRSDHTTKSEDFESDHSPKTEDSESERSPKSEDSKSNHSPKTEDSKSNHSPKTEDSESDPSPNSEDSEPNHSPKTDDSESEHSPKSPGSNVSLKLEEPESDSPWMAEDSASENFSKSDDMELDISVNSGDSIDISKSKNSSKSKDNLAAVNDIETKHFLKYTDNDLPLKENSIPTQYLGKKIISTNRDPNESNNSSPEPKETCDEYCKKSTLQSDPEKRLRRLHLNTNLSDSSTSTEDDLTHDIPELGEDSEDTESDEESKIAMKKISLKKRPKPKIFIRKRKLSTISEMDEENESSEESLSNGDNSGKVTQKSKRIKTCLKTLQSSSEESKSSYSDDDSAASR